MAVFGSRLLTLLYFLPFILVASSVEIQCSKESYGNPKFKDCYNLLAVLPSGYDAKTRLFVEQQLREDANNGWPGIQNPYSDPMVQIPKYWSRGTCNFALLSFYTDAGGVISVGTAAWEAVNVAAVNLISTCVAPPGTRSMGGAAVVQSGNTSKWLVHKNYADDSDAHAVTVPTTSVLTLFVWESGWTFDDVLNEYQNNPHTEAAYHGVPKCANRHTVGCGNITGVVS